MQHRHQEILVFHHFLVHQMNFRHRRSLLKTVLHIIINLLLFNFSFVTLLSLFLGIIIERIFPLILKVRKIGIASSKVI